MHTADEVFHDPEGTEGFSEGAEAAHSMHSSEGMGAHLHSSGADWLQAEQEGPRGGPDLDAQGDVQVDYGELQRWADCELLSEPVCLRTGVS